LNTISSKLTSVEAEVEIDTAKILPALNEAWGLRSSSKWTATNPARAQCSPTAVVIQDCFGGTLLKTPIEGAWHFYNRIDWNKRNT